MSSESKLNVWAKVGLVVLILAASAGIAFALIASKEEPKKKARENRGVLVRVEEVSQKERQLQVQAQGNVIAARRVTLQPQVSGEVVFVSEKLVPGGIVEKGDLLVRVEPADYRLAVQEARTAVRQAEAQLALEEGQQRVAKKEWELFKDEFEESDKENSLALREPQLQSAQVSVEAAKSRLERAELNLRRTSIRAPFNAVVLQDSVDLGQFVSTQTQMATLADADVAWVQASVSVDRIADIAIPGVNAEKGSEVTVELDSGRSSSSWKGRVIQLYGELDPQGRMARILVEVPKPIGPDSETEIPLLLGSYVDVTFGARGTANLVELDRESVRDGDKVFLYQDGELAIRKIDIAWRKPTTVLVKGGLDGGEMVVTSQIAAPVEGMKLRLGEGDDDPGTTKTAAVEEPANE